MNYTTMSSFVAQRRFPVKPEVMPIEKRNKPHPNGWSLLLWIGGVRLQKNMRQ